MYFHGGTKVAEMPRPKHLEAGSEAARGHGRAQGAGDRRHRGEHHGRPLVRRGADHSGEQDAGGRPSSRRRWKATASTTSSWLQGLPGRHADGLEFRFRGAASPRWPCWAASPCCTARSWSGTRRRCASPTSPRPTSTCASSCERDGRCSSASGNPPGSGVQNSIFAGKRLPRGKHLHRANWILYAGPLPLPQRREGMTMSILLTAILTGPMIACGADSGEAGDSRPPTTIVFFGGCKTHAPGARTPPRGAVAEAVPGHGPRHSAAPDPHLPRHLARKTPANWTTPRPSC